MSAENIIKNAIKTLGIEDTNENVVQQMQVQMYDALKTCGKLGQYGLYSNSPKNSLVIVMQINGQEEVLFGIEDDVNNRPRGLKEGEVMIYNTLTKNYIYLKEDGSTEAFTKTNLELKVTGTVYLKATKTIITGDVDINGNLNVSGAVKAGNGVSGTFTNSVTSTNGIVTAGN